MNDLLIEKLDLSDRTKSVLKRAGVNTFVELLNATDKELLDIRNIGEQSLREIRNVTSKCPKCGGRIEEYIEYTHGFKIGAGYGCTKCDWEIVY